jgi:hypothetical protein
LLWDRTLLSLQVLASCISSGQVKQPAIMFFDTSLNVGQPASTSTCTNLQLRVSHTIWTMYTCQITCETHDVTFANCVTPSSGFLPTIWCVAFPLSGKKGQLRCTALMGRWN